MQVHGFTCGVDDLALKNKINKTRKNMINSSHTQTIEELCKTFNCKTPEDVYYYGRSSYKCDEDGEHIPDEI